MLRLLVRLIAVAFIVVQTIQAQETEAQTEAAPPMSQNDKAMMLTQLIGKLQMLISDCLKQLTGMDLNAFLMLLPGKGAAIQQIIGKIIMLAGSLSG